MRTVATVNQKGGVAKTTTAACLGIGLARAGKKVLLVDADPQANLTQMLGFQNPDDISSPTLSDLIKEVVTSGESANPKEAILRSDRGVDFVPSNIDLSNVEITLVNVMSRESVMKKVLGDLKSGYDFVIVDCCPSLGMLTVNALAAADGLIVPVKADYLSAKGLESLLRTYGLVKKNLNPTLRIDGILFTMVENRTNAGREAKDLVSKTYGGPLRIFRTEIPKSVRLAEITTAEKSIYEHDKGGKAAEAYANFTKEVAELGRQLENDG